MKKILYAAGLLMLAPGLLMAQFSTTGSVTSTVTNTVGIGTTSPSNKLHVFSSTNYDGISVDGNNPAITLRNNGTLMGYAPGLVTTANYHFPGAAAGDIAFRTNSGRFLFGTTGNNATMSISNGRIAIGNLTNTLLNPAYPLTISSYVGSGFGYLSAMYTNNFMPLSEYGFGLENLGYGGHSYRFLAAANGSTVGAGNFLIADATVGATRFVIGPTGNIGIGTINPVDRLDIQGGNLSVYSGSATNLKVGSSDAGKTYLLMGTTADVNGASSLQSVGNSGTAYGALLLNPNGSNVGIGNTSPISKLHITGTGNSIDGGNAAIISDQSMTIQANTGGRNSTVGAQLEFAIPANTNGTNVYGQGRIITVADNANDQDATGKMILGTRRMFNKLGTGNQWYYGNDLVIDGTGKVGIATVNPGAVLDVAKALDAGQLGSILGRLTEGTNMGDGTYLGVRGYYTQTNATYTTLKDVKSFSLEHNFGGQTNSSVSFLRGGGYTGGSITFSTGTNLERIRITGDGNMGIGTSAPDSKLAVNGTIHAKEVKIDLNGWPDYVFTNSYLLPSLSTVKNYINANHHLPEMPTADEIENKGLELGKINKLLTKKVEELTLYLIQAEEKQKKQDELLQRMAERLKKLEDKPVID